MNKNKNISAFYTIMLLPGLLLFLTAPLTAQNVIRKAEDHFDRFTNVAGGWCAGDATISLPLPDGKTIWLFGDSFIGRKSGKYSIISSGSRMINNAVILDDGTEMTTIHGGSGDSPSSFIPPAGADIFWPEHAVMENDILKVFGVRIKFVDNQTPGFNFEVGTTYKAAFTYPGFGHISTTKFTSVTDSTFRFGACVVKSGEYTYIFGVKDTTAGIFTYPLPYLARVNESIDEPWQFYAGSGNWSYNCSEAVPVGDRPMSESFYVYEKNGRFYLIMHEIWLKGELFILEADRITGPWNRRSSGGTENRFAVISPHAGNITYNLFAHPQFQDEGDILISFNVNTSNFISIYQDTRNYRARFYWLDVEAAAVTVIPDTIRLFDDPVGIIDLHNGRPESRLVYDPLNGCLKLRDISSPALLEISGIDGRIYMEREIRDDAEINCRHLRGRMMIVSLRGKWGAETRKFFFR
ncbi:MAG TPA: hypothetical protein PLO24_06990 [Bacteroidales bacterium]|jgi:hypothetical protein|nr:hypothetical protein [Bacteroidales bacterium]HOS73266.1 hypothetical protein [Bacteroidales bacterium]HQH23289.1 hypothetical protein [Bacteroidales bacterium]HQJ82193.1 hypothetical protein [Bacteroidales bacterium]